MARGVLEIVHREECIVTARLEFGPGKRVRMDAEARVQSEWLASERLAVEGPLPLGALVRHVLARYGLEPAETDCAPSVEAGVLDVVPEREVLRA